MHATVNIYSEKKGELNKFLSQFFNTDLNIENEIKWTKQYANPVEIAEIIGTYIDNSDNFILISICGFALIKMFILISLKKMVIMS